MLVKYKPYLCGYFEQWHGCVISVAGQVLAALQTVFDVTRYTNRVKAFCVRSVISIPRVEAVWNVMVRSDALEGKWRGNRRLERVATTLALCLGTWSIHGLPADPHSSTASSRQNWLPPADLNGLVNFSERPNLVSARVPSRFKRVLLYV